MLELFREVAAYTVVIGGTAAIMYAIKHAGEDVPSTPSQPNTPRKEPVTNAKPSKAAISSPPL